MWNPAIRRVKHTLNSGSNPEDTPAVVKNWIIWSFERRSFQYDVGANLTGAGLGGCVLVLVREEDVDRLIETVHSRYYHQRNLQPAMMVCSAVGGAGRIW